MVKWSLYRTEHTSKDITMDSSFAYNAPADLYIDDELVGTLHFDEYPVRFEGKNGYVNIKSIALSVDICKYILGSTHTYCKRLRDNPSHQSLYSLYIYTLLYMRQCYIILDKERLVRKIST
jgi:hypothetical protein